MTADPPTENTNNDVFYLRQARVSSVLSNLPRKKIPKRTEGEQVSTGAEGINSDVFYETPGQRQDAKIPGKVAVSEQPGEGLNSELFHSRRARTIVSNKGIQELKPAHAAGAQKDKTGLTEGKDQDTFYVKNNGRDTLAASSPKVTDQETAELASDLLKYAEESTKPIAEQASSQMCGISLL